MDAYIYQADIYCEECALRMREGCRLATPGVEESGDSEDYPQGPYYDGGGEADSPQHCGSCRVFLENPLTGDGYDYVKEALQEQFNKFDAIKSDVLAEWFNYYNFKVSELKANPRIVWNGLEMNDPDPDEGLEESHRPKKEAAGAPRYAEVAYTYVGVAPVDAFGREWEVRCYDAEIEDFYVMDTAFDKEEALSTAEEYATENGYEFVGVVTEGKKAKKVESGWSDWEVHTKWADGRTASSRQRSVARWQTRGNDWLELFESESEDGTLSYSYNGNGQMGVLAATDLASAIAFMEANAVAVLKSDRPTLKRVEAKKRPQFTPRHEQKNKTVDGRKRRTESEQKCGECGEPWPCTVVQNKKRYRPEIVAAHSPTTGMQEGNHRRCEGCGGFINRVNHLEGIRNRCAKCVVPTSMTVEKMIESVARGNSPAKALRGVL